jgi:anthranilate phosphoribosyltransferase
MDSLATLTSLLGRNSDLNHEQAVLAAQLLAEAGEALQVKLEFLQALANKGETAIEVAAFASVFRGLAINPGVEAWADRAVDVCGTGGDGAGTFNISTAVSFVVAAAGVPVFKHGNRSITSKCGSADLLEAVGIRLDASHELIRKSLDELNYCFFFAPAYHLAFKEIMPVRKQMAANGQRSIFNLLGPLINPGQPAHQLLGVFSKQWVSPLADALGSLGLKAGLVVHGEPEPGVALDELSCAGENHLQGYGQLKDFNGALALDAAGLDSCHLSDLKGGDVTFNIELLHKLLTGDRGAVAKGLRDTVLLNAGAAFWISGNAANLEEGVAKADATLSSGSVKAWLARARAFYIAN